MDQQNLLQALLEQYVDQTNEWVQNVLGGIQSAPEDFNWLGFAEGAAFNARVGNKLSSTLPDLTWAKIAVTVYEYLLRQADEHERRSLELSIMRLKVSSIVAFGSVPDDPLLDVNSVLQWFFQKKEMSLDDAETKASNWKERPIEEIRKMRCIKNRLSVLKELVRNYPLEIDQELSDWLALWSKLP